MKCCNSFLDPDSGTQTSNSRELESKREQSEPEDLYHVDVQNNKKCRIQYFLKYSSV